MCGKGVTKWTKIYGRPSVHNTIFTTIFKLLTKLAKPTNNEERKTQ